MRHRIAISRCYPLLPVLLLSACAATPAFNTNGVDRTLTPQNVATHPQQATGKQVQWGGIILGTTNLEDRTQVEVLAYPLDANARPQSDGTPQGRFLLEQAGILDSATYAEGRQLTAVGTVTGTRAGKAGDEDVSYPVISARQLHLWPGRESDGVTVFGYIGFGAGGGGDTDSEVGFGF